MKTKIENGEKTFWLGMTETQLRVLRFAIGGVLLSKDTELPLAESISRQGGGTVVTDTAFLWETIEALEHGLGELAKTE